MAATPALLGLAVTVKGDLLACVALALAVGWLLRIKASSSPVLAWSPGPSSSFTVDFHNGIG